MFKLRNFVGMILRLGVLAQVVRWPNLCACFGVIGAALGTGLVVAQELPWPNKSGPQLTGAAAAEHARGLPTKWDEKSGENVAWKVALTGKGHSTPVIGRGRIWLTSATKDGKKQYVLCFDEKTGKILHHKLLFENEQPEPLGNPINTYASPTCVLEEDAVYVHFGTYGTARLDPQTAMVKWQRRDINCRHFRGPGSSPLVFEDLLILTFDGIDQQFLTALDKNTGQTVWRTDRSTDYGDTGRDGKPKRDGDFRKAYGTPGVIAVGKGHHLVSCGSRAAFGYDVHTGEEIWTITHKQFNAAAAPLFFQGQALINTGSRGSHLIAVRLNETTRGNVDRSHVVWDRGKGNARLCWPAMVEDRVYMVTDNGVLYCVDAATGKDNWVARLGGNFVSSPILAAGRLYVFDETGHGYVIADDAEKYRLIARNKLAEGARASPVVAGGALFLRTFGHLYKIAQ